MGVGWGGRQFKVPRKIKKPYKKPFVQIWTYLDVAGQVWRILLKSGVSFDAAAGNILLLIMWI